jgi:hypothetical protein
MCAPPAMSSGIRDGACGDDIDWMKPLGDLEARDELRSLIEGVS